MNNLSLLLKKETALEFFTKSGSMSDILKKIEDEVSTFVPDLSTDKGRKEIASMARKVAKSKVALDNVGKELTADWKGKAKKVDESRKEARDFLDNLRDKIRLPLTEYEEEKKQTEIAKKIIEAIESDHDEANELNEFFDREEKLKAKEIEIAEKERINREKEEALAEEKRKSEYEAQLKIEAKKQAEFENNEKIKREKEEKEQAIFLAKKAENEKAQAIKDAETARLIAIKDAEIEKERAIKAEQEKAKLIAKQHEQDRINKEIEEKRIADLKALDIKHRTKINNAALTCFKKNGFDEAVAREIIGLIVRNKISNISIKY